MNACWIVSSSPDACAATTYSEVGREQADDDERPFMARKGSQNGAGSEDRHEHDAVYLRVWWRNEKQRALS